jgi:hypothetical protein
MDYIVRPKRRVRGAGVAASSGQAPQDRLLAYIPLTIVGAYPILENALAQYGNTPPLPGLSLSCLERIVFALLILYYVLFLNKKYGDQGDYRGWVRVRLQLTQTIVSIAGFFIWTYSIKSAIWADHYNAPLALLASGLFALFGSLYAPTINLNQGNSLPQTPQTTEPPAPAAPPS